MVEIQEVGETTRPEHASFLKAFERVYLEPLTAAIRKKDGKKLDRLYAATVEGCNGRHAGTGHPCIRLKPPGRPVEDYMDSSLKADPRPEAR